MKTLEELYNEVLADKELAARYETLKNDEDLAAFAKSLGCDAAPEEIRAFMSERNSGSKELSDAELEQVVGGKDTSYHRYYHTGCGGEIIGLTHTWGWQCNRCDERHDYLDTFDYYTD